VNWLKKARHYFELVRFSHTLFALPFALASMLVAAGGLPNWKTLLAILICMAAGRNSAMAFNRLIDAKFDALNPRTAKRHIPAGILTRRSVILFILVNGIMFIAVAARLNSLALLCAAPVWFFLLSYSLWKRFSWGCHAFLGLAIGMSPLGAWIAVRGEFALFPALLGLVLATWIAGFDIIYATQDESMDRELGLHSIPVRFGVKGALVIARLCHLGTLLAAIALGVVFSLGVYWWVSFTLTVLMLLYIHFLRTSDDLDQMNRDFFLANAGISLVVFLGLLGEVYLRSEHVKWF